MRKPRRITPPAASADHFGPGTIIETGIPPLAGLIFLLVLIGAAILIVVALIKK